MESKLPVMWQSNLNTWCTIKFLWSGCMNHWPSSEGIIMGKAAAIKMPSSNG